MLYFDLKSIHVVVGALVVGLALASCLYVVLVRRESGTLILGLAVTRWLKVNALLVLPLVIVQMLLGFSIIAVRHYTMRMLWVQVTFVGFFVLLLAWIKALYHLLQFRQCLDCLSHYRKWRTSCLLALGALLLMLFFMANRLV
jgi:hypothetical protein